jgi:hypothetical protein
LKAAVLALKAGALREYLKAEVPRRSADAIVVSLCMGERESSVLLKGWEVAGGRWQKWKMNEPSKKAQTEQQPCHIKCMVTDPNEQNTEKNQHFGG